MSFSFTSLNTVRPCPLLRCFDENAILKSFLLLANAIARGYGLEWGVFEFTTTEPLGHSRCLC